MDGWPILCLALLALALHYRRKWLAIKPYHDAQVEMMIKGQRDMARQARAKK